MNKQYQIMRKGGAYSAFIFKQGKPCWPCQAYTSKRVAREAAEEYHDKTGYTVFLTIGEDWENPIGVVVGDIKQLKSTAVLKLLDKLGITDATKKQHKKKKKTSFQELVEMARQVDMAKIKTVMA